MQRRIDTTLARLSEAGQLSPRIQDIEQILLYIAIVIQLVCLSEDQLERSASGCVEGIRAQGKKTGLCIVSSGFRKDSRVWGLDWGLREATDPKPSILTGSLQLNACWLKVILRP